MHLRAIKLRGFKSFPEPVEVRLEPGVAVVVGPNGSGKSNVADAIVWAAGSMAPSELRAEKPDDVIFAGGGGRTAEDFCEVELLFDNPDGDGPARRTRSSRSRAGCTAAARGSTCSTAPRCGGSTSSSCSPTSGSAAGCTRSSARAASRRSSARSPRSGAQLLEEAAGLGRFKRRKHRAELKLARVAIQVERARDVEAEVKKRLRPLALQATAAERAEKLRGEIASLRARVAELDLAELRERLEDGEGRRTAAVLAPQARRRAARQRCSRSGGAPRRSSRTRPAGASRRPRRCTACAARASGSSCAARARSRCSTIFGPSSRGRGACSTRACAPSARRCASRRASARERLQTLERALAEREGLPPAARALAEEGERLALSLLDVEPGAERAVAAALGHRAAALVADDARAALALAERARAAGLGNVVVLTREPAQLVAELPGRPEGSAAAVAGAGSDARGLRLRPAARRDLVRRRDRGGGLARARGASPRTRRRGRGARRACRSADPRGRVQRGARSA